jgi:hypothetical protein
MTRHNPLYSALKRLREAGGKLPASALTPHQREALTRFGQQTRSVQRTASGRGDQFKVVEPVTVEQHWRTLCPVEPDAVEESWPDRSRNLARHRDSKLGTAQHTQLFAVLKAVSPISTAAALRLQEESVPPEISTFTPPPILWQNSATELDLQQATRAYGVGALALTPNDDWQSSQPLWLIENQALFERTDWFPATESAATLLYYAGQLPTRLVEWLARRPRTPDLVLFADYDGVGMSNFARLYAQLEGRCRIWLMPEWRTKLSRFGNSELWRKTRPDFEQAMSRLASHPPTPSLSEALQLMNSMQQQGLALEQEAVWL